MSLFNAQLVFLSYESSRALRQGLSIIDPEIPRPYPKSASVEQVQSLLYMKEYVQVGQPWMPQLENPSSCFY